MAHRPGRGVSGGSHAAGLAVSGSLGFHPDRHRPGGRLAALILTYSLTQACRVAHPPSLATALLLVLGPLQTTGGAMGLSAGALILAEFGRLLRKV